MNKMSRKVSEVEQIKALYVNLKDEMEKSDDKFKRQIRVYVKKMMANELQKREMHADIANQKRSKIRMASQIAYFVSEIVSLKQQKKSSEKYIKHLENKIKNLNSSNNLLTEEITERKKSLISITSSISSEHTITSQDMVQNISNINGEEDNNYRINILGEKVYTSSVADISGPNSERPSESILQGPSESNLQGPSESNLQGPSESNLQGPSESNLQGPSESILQGPSESILQGPSESILQDTCNESAMSSAMCNKSVQGEERGLNHSIVTEIKEDDPNGKDIRPQGSKRSKAIYLPHMRSFRRIKLNQNGSPFHRRLYYYMTQQSEAKDMVNNNQSEVSAVNKCQMDQTASDEQINEKKAVHCHNCGVPFDTRRLQASLENPVQAAAGSGSDLITVEDEDAIEFEDVRSTWFFPKRSRGSKTLLDSEDADSEDSESEDSSQ